MTGSYLVLLLVGAVFAATAMAVLWAIQVRTCDASHVDIGWAIEVALVSTLGLARVDRSGRTPLPALPRDRHPGDRGPGTEEPRRLRGIPAHDERLHPDPSAPRGGGMMAIMWPSFSSAIRSI